MAELKPCPFCGGEAELWWNGIRQCHEVRCKQCSARGGYCDGMEDAIEAWNKRTERPKGRWVWDEMFSDYTCSVCHNWDLKTPNFCSNCGTDMRGESDGC